MLSGVNHVTATTAANLMMRSDRLALTWQDVEQLCEIALLSLRTISRSLAHADPTQLRRIPVKGVRRRCNSAFKYVEWRPALQSSKGGEQCVLLGGGRQAAHRVAIGCRSQTDCCRSSLTGERLQYANAVAPSQANSRATMLGQRSPSSASAGSWRSMPTTSATPMLRSDLFRFRPENPLLSSRTGNAPHCESSCTSCPTSPSAARCCSAANWRSRGAWQGRRLKPGWRE